jgi:hypothetical protein
MSPLEIRQALQNGIEWHYSAQACWNGAAFSDSEYRHYLSKNVYYFSTTLRAQAGARSAIDRMMIYLTPENGDGPWVPFLANRITHSPASFFAAP